MASERVVRPGVAWFVGLAPVDATGQLSIKIGQRGFDALVDVKAGVGQNAARIGNLPGRPNESGFGFTNGDIVDGAGSRRSVRKVVLTG